MTTPIPHSSQAAHAEPAVPKFQPYIPSEVTMREFTPRAVVMGTLLGMVFGASSLYLVLKVGLTVSASIPVAVIAITLFRLLSKFGFKDATILENNIVQSAGSAGESIAFGVGVTMPAILILGFDLELTPRLAGGDPRRAAGGADDDPAAACADRGPARGAQVPGRHRLRRSAQGGRLAGIQGARLRGAEGPRDRRRWASSPTRPPSSSGSPSGLFYKTLMKLFILWKEIPEKIFGAPYKGGSISAEISPELLGVGYIIGPRIASIMCAGGVLSYLVLDPGDQVLRRSRRGDGAAGDPMPISEMGPHELRGAYMLYIGAGAVAAGGIVSVLRSLPIICPCLAQRRARLQRGARRRDRRPAHRSRSASELHPDWDPGAAGGDHALGAR